MQAIRKFKHTLQKADFFSSNQYLKFEGEEQYKTLTGGVISLGLVVIISIAFSNMIIQTLNKIKIDSTLQTNLFPSPPPIKVTGGNKFMIGINVKNINLNTPTRKYDVRLQYYQVNNLIQNKTYLPLQPCTKQHWGDVANSFWLSDQQLDKVKNDSQRDPRQWLCVPINQSLQLFGIAGTQSFKYIQFLVQPCNSKNNYLYNRFTNSTCVYNLTQDQNYLKSNSLQLKAHYIDSVINPNKLTSISFFKNKTPSLTAQYGRYIRAQVQLNDYQINTDVSILPFQDIQTIQGGHFQEYQQIIDVSQSTTDFFGLGFRVSKSKKSLVYTRSVAKISAVFSYIGGFVGAILSVMFFLNNYTGFALEIAIAANIFENPNRDNSQTNEEDKQKVILKQTNIFQYAKFQIFKLINSFSKQSINWPKYKYMEDYITQINTHLDIKNLIKRVICLQYYMRKVIKEEQFQLLTKFIPTDYEHIKINRLKITNLDQRKRQEIAKLSRVIQKRKTKLQIVNSQELSAANFNLNDKLINQIEIQPKIQKNLIQNSSQLQHNFDRNIVALECVQIIKEIQSQSLENFKQLNISNKPIFIEQKTKKQRKTLQDALSIVPVKFQIDNIKIDDLD